MWPGSGSRDLTRTTAKTWISSRFPRSASGTVGTASQMLPPANWKQRRISKETRHMLRKTFLTSVHERDAWRCSHRAERSARPAASPSQWPSSSSRAASSRSPRRRSCWSPWSWRSSWSSGRWPSSSLPVSLAAALVQRWPPAIGAGSSRLLGARYRLRPPGLCVRPHRHYGYGRSGYAYGYGSGDTATGRLMASMSTAIPTLAAAITPTSTATGCAHTGAFGLLRIASEREQGLLEDACTSIQPS